MPEHANIAGADAPVVDYETYVTGMLSWLTNRLSSGASALYRRMFGIGVMEWRVMAHLAIEPGSTAAAIGRVIGLDKAAISRTVSTLQARDLVMQTNSGSRGRQLVLTGAGHALHSQVYAVAMQRETQLLACLPATDRDVLRDLLQRLLREVPMVGTMDHGPHKGG